MSVATELKRRWTFTINHLIEDVWEFARSGIDPKISSPPQQQLTNKAVEKLFDDMGEADRAALATLDAQQKDKP